MDYWSARHYHRVNRGNFRGEQEGQVPVGKLDLSSAQYSNRETIFERGSRVRIEPDQSTTSSASSTIAGTLVQPATSSVFVLATTLSAA